MTYYGNGVLAFQPNNQLASISTSNKCIICENKGSLDDVGLIFKFRMMYIVNKLAAMIGPMFDRLNSASNKFIATVR